VASIDLSITDDWPLAQAFVIISAAEASKTGALAWIEPLPPQKD